MTTNLIETRPDGKLYFVVKNLMPRLAELGFRCGDDATYVNYGGQHHSEDYEVTANAPRGSSYNSYLRAVNFKGYGYKLRVPAEKSHQLAELFNNWMAQFIVPARAAHQKRLATMKVNITRIEEFKKALEKLMGKSIFSDRIQCVRNNEGFKVPTGLTLHLTINGTTPEEIYRKYQAVLAIE